MQSFKKGVGGKIKTRQGKRHCGRAKVKRDMDQVTMEKEKNNCSCHSLYLPLAETPYTREYKFYTHPPNVSFDQINGLFLEPDQVDTKSHGTKR